MTDLKPDSLPRPSRAAVWNRVRARATVDTRALAALRILLGVTILIDLAHRWSGIELFYSDYGMYPVSAYETTYSRFTGLSMHAWSGEVWFQQLLFVIAALFAVALILGYRTRLVAIVSLVFLVSLQARNPAVLNGGDRLFRVLLLLAILTPIGERWSIDALRRGSARTQVTGFATLALLAQPLAVFSANAVEKHEGDTWYQGEALEIAMANDVMTVYLGNYLTAFPPLLEGLTYGWVVLLSGSIVFLFLTVGRLRAFFALVYISAFAGMATAMSVGLFPLVLTASVLAYLTPPFWDTIARRVPDRVTRYRPTAEALGPLSKPPLERRVLAQLRESDYERVADFGVEYARSFVSIIGLFALVWIVLFSAADVTSYEVPDEIDHQHLNEQRWGLYAPNPSTAYSWYAVEAELAIGQTVDPFDGGTVTADRPPDASQEYADFRERKYLETVRDSGGGDTNGLIAVNYAEWACQSATENLEGHAEVESVTVHRFLQSSPIDGEYDDVRHRTVIEYDC
ncbi:HTTM domain-containing protein [Natronosalvus vescus]|uniref:HTTM domain-containing protein n=1 Tax=Natronosalvus vescus TaxID=2953881 RepID=UPI00209147B4|nr:HTTM domain-containing protein [Natronosalvus vescus]